MVAGKRPKAWSYEMSESVASLSETIVNRALDALDWGALSAHLNGLALDEVSAERLVGLVLRSRSLVFRYPGKVARRAEILDGVVAKVRLDLGDEAAGSADRRLAVFAVIDEGYAGIRALITALPLATAPRAKATSAYLAYVARTWATLRRKIEETSAEPQFAGGPVVSTSEGQRFGADAMTSLLVNLLGMNVTLASYQGGWFDDDGLVRLPDLPVPEDVDVISAGAADHTALAWQQWQLIEERCRYFGGTLTRRSAIEDEVLPSGSVVFVHDPHDLEWEILDSVANERLGDRLRQTFIDMWMKTNISKKGTGILSNTPMPPAGYVSPSEAHSVVMLCEYLGLDVVAHPADLGGLPLRAWIRGFAVLQQLANDAIDGRSFETAAFPRMALDELEDVLERNGLSNGAARRFIDHASFSRSSRDLYDTPIIRGTGDWCLLVAPALSDALLFRLVLSTLANKRLEVVGKGEAFERQFRALLTAQGLPVYGFETRRDGQTYEYDAVMPWGNYLFVFECKNRALSGTNPIASFNFLRSTEDHVGQVQRLVQALKDHPEILTDNVKEDCTGLILVPVVLSSMPFSVPGTIDGVYFNDSAAIGRFFQERYAHAVRLHDVDGNPVMHRVRVHSQWADDRPTADDLLQHLELPLQLRMQLPHVTARSIGIQIGFNLYASTRIPRREETTLDSMATTVGLTGEAIEAEMERVKKDAIDPLRAHIERDADREKSGELNRTGFSGGSNFQVGWSHDEQNDEQVSA